MIFADTFSDKNGQWTLFFGFGYFCESAKNACGQKKWANGHFFFKSGQATNGFVKRFVRVRGHFPTFFGHFF